MKKIVSALASSLLATVVLTGCATTTTSLPDTPVYSELFQTDSPIVMNVKQGDGFNIPYPTSATEQQRITVEYSNPLVVEPNDAVQLKAGQGIPFLAANAGTTRVAIYIEGNPVTVYEINVTR